MTHLDKLTGKTVKIVRRIDDRSAIVKYLDGSNGVRFMSSLKYLKK